MTARPVRVAACRLALAFGEPDVDRFLAGIDSGQFLEWCDYLAIENSGDEGMQVGAGAMSRAGPRKNAAQVEGLLRAYFPAR